VSALTELEATLQLRKGLPPVERRRALRVAAGASLAQVADVCKVSPQAVLAWERGAEPSGANLVAYSKVLRLFSELGAADAAA
jgi:transcriptional regulator with XRE-family HTH domain